MGGQVLIDIKAAHERIECLSPGTIGADCKTITRSFKGPVKNGGNLKAPLGGTEFAAILRT